MKKIMLVAIAALTFGSCESEKSKQEKKAFKVSYDSITEWQNSICFCLDKGLELKMCDSLWVLSHPAR